ncbi:MAG TPA: hypothetical protein VK925_02400 [Jiangellaceae bacterium]|nr:hypothetical protein [Jiangellaceae bacterium]
MNPVGVGVFLVPAIAVGVAVVWAMVAPVSRSRLERFARRQQLQITPDNGDLVIRYLAITRRWRAGGILVAFGLGIVWLSTRIDFSGEINLLQLFAGWFAGAVLAEARLARTPAGPVRLAALQPRDPSMYLPRYAQWLVPAALAVSVALGLVTVTLAAAGRSPDVRTAAVAQVAAVAVAGMVLAVGRHVLSRPQPVLPPDQLAADDAIRSRALHVLAGSGTALVLYAVISQLSALADGLSGQVVDVIGGTVFVLVFAAPLLGWFVATQPWSVRRDAQQPAHLG